MTSSPGDPPGALHREYVADLTTLRTARREVVDWLADQGADEDARDRAALIVSELTSNAVQSGPGTTYTLHVSRLERSAVISVRNRPTTGRPPPREKWVAPASVPLRELTVRGRGLAIVDSLSEEVTVEHDGEAVVVTARVRIDAAG